MRKIIGSIMFLAQLLVGVMIFFAVLVGHNSLFASADEEDVDNQPESLSQIINENCRIYLHDQDNVQLVSETAIIPLTFVNTCKSDVTFSVFATSNSEADLEIDGQIGITTVEANSEAKIGLNVHAKSNGDSILDIKIIGDDGQIYTSTRINVHSLRDVGTVLTYIFFGLVAVLVVFGSYRTVKKIRGKDLNENE